MPAPSPISGSAPTAPRWVRFSSMNSPSLTMPWDFSPRIWATNPTPQASCSLRGSYRPCFAGKADVLARLSVALRRSKAASFDGDLSVISFPPVVALKVSAFLGRPDCPCRRFSSGTVFSCAANSCDQPFYRCNPRRAIPGLSVAHQPKPLILGPVSAGAAGTPYVLPAAAPLERPLVYPIPGHTKIGQYGCPIYPSMPETVSRSKTAHAIKSTPVTANCGNTA